MRPYMPALTGGGHAAVFNHFLQNTIRLVASFAQYMLTKNRNDKNEIRCFKRQETGRA